MLGTLVVFMGVSALVICTPGPDTAVTIRNALAGGRRSGVLTAVGVGSGQLIWTVATVLGLAGLVAASRPAFEALRLVGAAYLIVLGVLSLWSAVRGNRAHGEETGARPAATRPLRAFRQGLVNDLANPKMAAFFVSLFPQFVPHGAVGGSLLLGIVFSLMTVAWLSAYALVLDRARQWFARPMRRRILDGAGGLVLVGFGVRVATE